MELRQLKTFITVARTGSFTRAAELLGYAQSSITTHIHALEMDLRTKLFDRIGHRVCLTSEGRVLFSYADRILKLTEEAREIVSPANEPHGTLAIGTCESLATYRLPKILQRYSRIYPKVEIALKHANCSILRELIRRNEVDAGLFFERPVTDPDFIVDTLSGGQGEQMVLIMMTGHHLSGGDIDFPNDLAGERLIISEPGCSLRASIETILDRYKVAPRSLLEVGGIESAKQLVMHGIGVAILQRFVVEQDISDRKLDVCSLQEPALEYFVQFVYHRDKWLSPALKAFLEITRDVLQCNEQD